MKESILRRWFQRRREEARKEGDTSGPLPIAPHRATVLVVDDSRTQVAALVKMLTQAGYETLTAENGRVAIEEARKHLPDAVLMDIVMPVMDGFKATRALNRLPETSHIPVIIISGVERESDVFWGGKMGARGFIAKPVTAKELLPKLAAVLSERQENTG